MPGEQNRGVDLQRKTCYRPVHIGVAPGGTRSDEEPRATAEVESGQQVAPVTLPQKNTGGDAAGRSADEQPIKHAGLTTGGVRPMRRSREVTKKTTPGRGRRGRAGAPFIVEGER